MPFYYAVLSAIAESNLVMDQTLKLPHRVSKSTLYDMQHCHGHFRSDGSFDTLANPSRRVFSIILQLPIFSEPRELVQRRALKGPSLLLLSSPLLNRSSSLACPKRMSSQRSHPCVNFHSASKSIQPSSLLSVFSPKSWIITFGKHLCLSRSNQTD